jgi:hypothetical protein
MPFSSFAAFKSEKFAGISTDKILSSSNHSGL